MGYLIANLKKYVIFKYNTLYLASLIKISILKTVAFDVLMSKFTCRIWNDRFNSKVIF